MPSGSGKNMSCISAQKYIIYLCVKVDIILGVHDILRHQAENIESTVKIKRQYAKLLFSKAKLKGQATIFAVINQFPGKLSAS